MNRLNYYYLIICLLAGSCSPSDEISRPMESEQILARVGDKTFEFSDLQGAMPVYRLHPKDSAAMAREIVTDWVRQQLLRKQAEKELEDNDPEDIRKKAEDYRNQLIIFALQKQYIRENLDSAISEEEISTYYKKYSENFLLNENIGLLRYVKIRTNNPKIADFRKKFTSRNRKDRDEIAGMCRVYADDFELADSNWVNMDKVFGRSPFLLQYNRQQIIKAGFNSEIADDLHTYFINIYDVRKSGQKAPQNYVLPMIHDLIFNQRKTRLQKKLEDDVFENASPGSDYELMFK